MTTQDTAELGFTETRRSETKLAIERRRRRRGRPGKIWTPTRRGRIIKKFATRKLKRGRLFKVETWGVAYKIILFKTLRAPAFPLKKRAKLFVILIT